MTKFQIVLTGIFGFFLVVGILIFAIARPNSGSKTPVLVWGSIPQSTMSKILMNLPISEDKRVNITYRYVPDVDFDQQFIEALASGRGPDVVLLAQDSFLKHRDKLVPIPYSSYTERDFKSTFVEVGELFLDPKGIYAFPITVDPLVLYWNRNILTSANISQPPQYWDELYTMSQSLTKKDGALNIVQATIPFGEYANSTNAKEILSALMLQAGSEIITRGQLGYQSALSLSGLENEYMPAVLAVNYYTEFSNPGKAHYTWNRSLPPSQTMFLSGDLAFYPGFASELPFLTLKNPNLNFDVTVLPQSRGNTRKTTFGKMQGLAVVKNTKNSGAAFIVISGLVGKDAAKVFSNELGLPPARRDLISEKQTDAEKVVFYESSLISKAWVDPDKRATSNMFQDMIESITGGRERSIQAVLRAQAVLNDLISKIPQ